MPLWLANLFWPEYHGVNSLPRRKLSSLINYVNQQNSFWIDLREPETLDLHGRLSDSTDAWRGTHSLLRGEDVGAVLVAEQAVRSAVVGQSTANVRHLVSVRAH